MPAKPNIEVVRSLRKKDCEGFMAVDSVDTNMAIWLIFIVACKKAAVHLGKHHEETLRAVRDKNNPNFR